MRSRVLVRSSFQLTDNLTDAAVNFIDRNRNQPFFLYISYYAVHSPVQVKSALIDSYAGSMDPSGRNNAKYAAMVQGVDDSIGRLVNRIDALGLTSNTVLFFFSDNGGVPRFAFNGEFRSGKGFLWEGGIRKPLIVKWPDVIQAGSVECTPVTGVDFFPTILEMTGVEDSKDHTRRGESVSIIATDWAPFMH